MTSQNNNVVDLIIEPHDPLVFRDGRSFSPTSGNRMTVKKWVPSSTLAGALRTHAGKANGGFNAVDVTKIKQISITAPLPYCNETLFYPAPADVVWQAFGDNMKDEKTKTDQSDTQENQNACNGYKYFPILPHSIDGNAACDLPDGLIPAMICHNNGDDFKPSKNAPAWWSKNAICKWLDDQKNFFDEIKPDTDFMRPLQLEDRVHVKISPQSGTAEESMLFTTSGACFTNNGMSVKIAVQCKTVDDAFLSSFTGKSGYLPLGGERRLAHWQHTDKLNGMYKCPEDLIKALDNVKAGDLVRMYLVTPAYFEGGWRPGWIDDKLVGSPPASNGRITLELVSVACGRCEYASGWSYESDSFGPKASRRLVPAGSVYFFRLKEGDPEVLKDLWMKPISDDEGPCRDGLGTALWGRCDMSKINDAEAN